MTPRHEADCHAAAAHHEYHQPLEMPYRWDDLRLLLAVARAGSLKRAAHDLEVNISTVARRLDALEEGLSLHLFDRTPDGTVPTAAAEQLLPFAESMEHAATGFSNALDGFEAEPEGVVRITAPPGVADHFVAPMIGELLGRHPKLRVELWASIGYADLTRREADIALRLMRPTTGDLVAVRLGAATSVVTVSETLAAEIGTLKRLDDLRWITYADDLGHLPETSWITSQVSTQRIALRSNSMTAHLEAARSGLGATLAAKPFASLPGLSALRLSRRLAKEVLPFPESPLWLVGHRALRDVPRVAAVWTFILERLDEVLSR
jgi:DNA-binding transcriptional LysR family regulator